MRMCLLLLLVLMMGFILVYLYKVNVFAVVSVRFALKDECHGFEWSTTKRKLGCCRRLPKDLLLGKCDLLADELSDITFDTHEVHVLTAVLRMIETITSDISHDGAFSIGIWLVIFKQRVAFECEEFNVFHIRLQVKLLKFCDYFFDNHFCGVSGEAVYYYWHIFWEFDL